MYGYLLNVQIAIGRQVRRYLMPLAAPSGNVAFESRQKFAWLFVYQWLTDEQPILYETKKKMHECRGTIGWNEVKKTD